MELNEEQGRVVAQLKGPILAECCPGSGKTKTLTVRVAQMLTHHGINPGNILCLTFTNKAADEMKSRLRELVGTSADKIWISTFHKLCIAVLRKFGKLINLEPNFSIFDDRDQSEMIRKIARMQEVESLSDGDVKRLAKMVNDAREDLHGDLDKLAGEAQLWEKQVCAEYLTLLDECNAVDFSGILFKTYILLKGHPEVTQQLTNKFQYVCVDEAQDTNQIQYEIADMIAAHGNILLVGDFQQSIYSWRGARPENLNRFLKDHPDALVVNFQMNYRSRQNILNCAQRLIRQNENGRHVVLKSSRGTGGVVKASAHSCPEAEADHVAQQIMHLRQKHQLHWNDFAVLYRMNSLSKTPEAALRKYHIPYKVLGGFSFFDRSEVKTALAYFAFAANPSNTIAFARAIANPKRGVGEVIVGKLEKHCKDHQVDMLAACKSNAITMNGKTRQALDDFVAVVEKVRGMDVAGSDALGHRAATLLKDSGFYTSMVQESKSDRDYEKRVANVDQLLLDVAKFGKDKPNGTFSDYLHVIQLLSAEDDEDEDDSKVTLLTMHAAKGLEFPVVFIIAAENGTCPHTRAVAERGEDEERRLFYVAETRAEDFLFISYCVARSQWSGKWQREYTRQCEPSPFIEESGL